MRAPLPVRAHPPNESRCSVLVLTRTAGETIVIGDNVRITLDRVTRSGRVRLAIDAPPHVTIRRLEVAGAPELDRREQ